MSAGFEGLLLGAVGGGVVALVLRIVETHWLGPTFTESREAHKTLLRYSRPLALSCDDAEYRIDRILKQADRSEAIAFKCSPSDAKSLDWFTRDGYYVTSTAYLLSAVLAWIALLQRDVVFLRFRRKSVTTEFFDRIRNLRVALSTGTYLWYYYLDWIGERLVPEGADRPMSLSAFSEKLLTTPSFRQCYDQLFEFLRRCADGEFIEELRATLQCLRELKVFLQRHGAVPDVTLREQVASR